MNLVSHTPVENLVVNGQIKEILLNLCPDFGNSSVTRLKICFRRQTNNLFIDFWIRITRSIPRATLITFSVDKKVKDILRVIRWHTPTEHIEVSLKFANQREMLCFWLGIQIYFDANLA